MAKEKKPSSLAKALSKVSGRCLPEGECVKPAWTFFILGLAFLATAITLLVLSGTIGGVVVVDVYYIFETTVAGWIILGMAITICAMWAIYFFGKRPAVAA